MGLGKQAKVLSKGQQTAVMLFLESTRQPLRNKTIFLLSIKSGLRAKEIASLTWGMVTNSDGEISDRINLTDEATKGKSGGVIWLNKELRRSLIELHKHSKVTTPKDHIIQSERRGAVSPQTIVNMFSGWYKKLGFIGCSSHSGRRTFITNAAKRISTVGGSIRDVQQLARHSSLSMTQKYIECDVEAMKKVVDLI